MQTAPRGSVEAARRCSVPERLSAIRPGRVLLPDGSNRLGFVFGT